LLAPVLTLAICASLAGAIGSGSAWAGAKSADGGTWNINTVAGGYGTGPVTQVDYSADCAVDASGGYIYATSGGLIRRISTSTGYMTTPVGSQGSGTSPDGTPGNQTSLGWSCGVAVDQHGNLIFADSAYWLYGSATSGANLIRVQAAATGSFYGQAMKAGDVYTIAGNGKSGYSGDGGPALDAELDSPGGISVDSAGNVIVVDAGNDVVRVIAERTGSFYGQSMTAGDIYTVAGTGSIGCGTVGSGVQATSADLCLNPEYDGINEDSEPWPVAEPDSHGNIVLGDIDDGVLRVIAGTAGTFYGQAMKAGDIYTIATGLGVIGGVAIDHHGNIVVSNIGDLELDVVAASDGDFYGRAMKAGHTYLIAGTGNTGPDGNGGPALKAAFSGPNGVTVDSAGNIVLVDSGGYDQYYEFTDNLLWVIAESNGTYYGVRMKAGDAYVISGNRGTSFYGNGVRATDAVLYPAPMAATDKSGNLYLSDGGNERVRMVPAVSGTYFGRKMTAGDIYTIAGDGRARFRGDGGPAPLASFRYPFGLVVDGSGNVLVVDRGNHRVRVIAARTGRFYGQRMKTGDIYTIAGNGRPGDAGDGGPALRASLSLPQGIAQDHHGNIVVTDPGSGRIRVIAQHTGTFYGIKMKAGDIYTVSRLTAVAVAVDGAGNLVTASQNFIRVVAEKTGTYYGIAMKAGHFYDVAGVGKTGPVGDGGPATAAFIDPTGVALDSSGSIVISDARDTRVRVVAEQTGSFYGQSMTAGDIYTIAGPGRGPLGDGGPAVDATLSYPASVAVTPSGAILLADDDLIRKIMPNP
jgi:predicted RecB family endonuclease